ncbi:MAG: glycerophosphodiester phosphodiesterase family protein [Peptoniphilaceae bacterium]|nr:glycerophosphodiester phosphodiesterase family protein [Peptoniphilaceae bacterium]
MKLFAYRGESERYPENTMLAFREALKSGADGIQLDVHLSRDHHPVIFHDDSLARMTDGIGFIRHHSIQDIESYRLKQEDHLPEQHIPLFEEYLAWAKKLPHETLIHLKNDSFYYPQLEQIVIELLDNYAMTERVILSSHRLESLKTIREHRPDIRLAWYVDSPSEEQLAELKELEIHWILPHVNAINKKLVTLIREYGLQAIPYVVSNRIDMEKIEPVNPSILLTTDVMTMRTELNMTERPFSDEQLKFAEEPDSSEKQDSEKITGRARFLSGKERKKNRSSILSVILSMAICVTIASAIAGVFMNLLSRFIK